jgi:NAD-dependent dihydropyrimidine dehydrogenase PreA subunit
MKINGDTCIGCGLCVPFCPMEAISVAGSTAVINEDECVECGVCLRSNSCPTEAFVQQELTWPRVLRQYFSDPTYTHPSTGIPGRGTAEMKTNDVTGRYCLGEAAFALDIGRPGMGTRLRDVEKIYARLVRLGVQFESDNPVRGLLKNENKGSFKEEVLNEKVLSAIIEFKVPTESISDVLTELGKAAQEIDTVFSVGIIDKVAPDGSMPNCEEAIKLGYRPYINAKVCVGTGRPLAHFEGEL